MSLAIVIVCDGCGRHGPRPATSAPAAWHEAKAAGWVRYGGEMVCTDCQGETVEVLPRTVTMVRYPGKEQ